MSETSKGAKAPKASAPEPNEPPSTGGEAQGSPAPSATPTATKRGWGAPSRPEDWVSLRSLVAAKEDGKGNTTELTGVPAFHLVRVSTADINPSTGPSAGVSRPSYVFELSDGHLFSVNRKAGGRAGDSIGNQVDAFGIPPSGEYYVASMPSSRSGTGDALLLRPGPLPKVAPQA